MGCACSKIKLKKTNEPSNSQQQEISPKNDERAKNTQIESPPIDLDHLIPKITGYHSANPISIEVIVPTNLNTDVDAAKKDNSESLETSQSLLEKIIVAIEKSNSDPSIVISEFCKFEKKVLSENFLKSEGKAKLKGIKNKIQNKNFSGPLPDLKTLLKDHLIILDVRQIQAMSAPNSQLQNNDVVLFLGSTGVGKSTSILFLAGFELKENPPKSQKYEIEKVPQYLQHMNMNIAIGNEVVSKTIEATILEIPKKDLNSFLGYGQDESLMICDSPGLFDTRGAERDIANQHGLIKSVRMSRSVKIVYVISQFELGDRCTFSKKVAENLSQMISLDKDRMQSILFLFTKINDMKKLKDDIKEKLSKETNDDPNERHVLLRIEEQFSEGEMEFKINIGDSNNRSRILKKIVRLPSIKQPSSSFKYFSPKNCDADKKITEKIESLQARFASAIKNSFEFNFSEIKFTLKEISILKEILSEGFQDQFLHIQTICLDRTEQIFQEQRENFKKSRNFRNEINTEDFILSFENAREFKKIFESIFPSENRINIDEYTSIANDEIRNIKAEFDQTPEKDPKMKKNCEKLFMIISYFKKIRDCPFDKLNEDEVKQRILRKCASLSAEAEQYLREMNFMEFFEKFQDLKIIIDNLVTVFINLDSHLKHLKQEFESKMTRTVDEIPSLLRDLEQGKDENKEKLKIIIMSILSFEESRKIIPLEFFDDINNKIAFIFKSVKEFIDRIHEEIKKNVNFKDQKKNEKSLEQISFLKGLSSSLKIYILNCSDGVLNEMKSNFEKICNYLDQQFAISNPSLGQEEYHNIAQNIKKLQGSAILNGEMRSNKEELLERIEKKIQKKILIELPNALQSMESESIRDYEQYFDMYNQFTRLTIEFNLLFENLTPRIEILSKQITDNFKEQLEIEVDNIRRDLQNEKSIIEDRDAQKIDGYFSFTIECMKLTGITEIIDNRELRSWKEIIRNSIRSFITTLHQDMVEYFPQVRKYNNSPEVKNTEKIYSLGRKINVNFEFMEEIDSFPKLKGEIGKMGGIANKIKNLKEQILNFYKTTLNQTEDDDDAPNFHTISLLRGSSIAFSREIENISNPFDLISKKKQSKMLENLEKDNFEFINQELGNQGASQRYSILLKKYQTKSEEESRNVLIMFKQQILSSELTDAIKENLTKKLDVLEKMFECLLLAQQKTSFQNSFQKEINSFNTLVNKLQDFYKILPTYEFLTEIAEKYKFKKPDFQTSSEKVNELIKKEMEEFEGNHIVMFDEDNFQNMKNISEQLDFLENKRDIRTDITVVKKKLEAIILTNFQLHLDSINNQVQEDYYTKIKSKIDSLPTFLKKPLNNTLKVFLINQKTSENIQNQRFNDIINNHNFEQIGNFMKDCKEDKKYFQLLEDNFESESNKLAKELQDKKEDAFETLDKLLKFNENIKNFGRGFKNNKAKIQKLLENIFPLIPENLDSLDQIINHGEKAFQKSFSFYILMSAEKYEERIKYFYEQFYEIFENNLKSLEIFVKSVISDFENMINQKEMDPKFFKKTVLGYNSLCNLLSKPLYERSIDRVNKLSKKSEELVGKLHEKIKSYSFQSMIEKCERKKCEMIRNLEERGKGDNDSELNEYYSAAAKIENMFKEIQNTNTMSPANQLNSIVIQNGTKIEEKANNLFQEFKSILEIKMSQKECLRCNAILKELKAIVNVGVSEPIEMELKKVKKSLLDKFLQLFSDYKQELINSQENLDFDTFEQQLIELQAFGDIEVMNNEVMSKRDEILRKFKDFHQIKGIRILALKLKDHISGNKIVNESPVFKGINLNVFNKKLAQL